MDLDTLDAPLAWRVAAGHRLVELEWTEGDLVDIWVMNIWKEYKHLPAIEAVNAWYSVYEEAQAQIKAGTHPHIKPFTAWSEDFESAWSRLVFGEYDSEATSEEAFRLFAANGHRPGGEVAQEYFDSMPADYKAQFAGRVHRPKAVWVPPTV